MISALLALSLLAAPDATPTPSPSPTPPPSQDGPGLYDPVAEPGDPIFEPLPPRAQTPPRSLPDIAIVPSIGIGGHLSTDARDRRIAGLHYWGGVLFHPAPSKFGPMMGLGVSGDCVSSRDGKQENGETCYAMPELRYGVAFIDRPHQYSSTLFPIASIYFLGGWRPERGVDGGLYRAGVGVSSPMFFAFGIAQTCIPLPSMVEFAIDAPDGDFSGGGARSTFRAGWQF